MTSQVTVRFALPSDSKRGLDFNEGRKLIAKALGADPLAKEVLHYKDGQPKNGMPLVRISESKKDIRLVFLGEAEKLSWQILPAAQKGISSLLEEPVAISVSTESVGISDADYLMPYRIKKMALRKAKNFANLTPEGRAAIVCDRINYGIMTQCRQLGIDVDIHETLDQKGHSIFTGLDTVKPENVMVGRFLDHFKIKPFGTDDDAREYRNTCVAEVDFLWDKKIKGDWAVGGLTARGFGRVWYNKEVAL